MHRYLLIYVINNSRPSYPSVSYRILSYHGRLLMHSLQQRLRLCRVLSWVTDPCVKVCQHGMTILSRGDQIHTDIVSNLVNRPLPSWYARLTGVASYHSTDDGNESLLLDGGEAKHSGRHVLPYSLLPKVRMPTCVFTA